MAGKMENTVARGTRALAALIKEVRSVNEVNITQEVSSPSPLHYVETALDTASFAPTLEDVGHHQAQVISQVHQLSTLYQPGVPHASPESVPQQAHLSWEE